FGTIGKDDKFTPAETVSVKAKIAAYTKDVPYEGGKLLTYRWTAPDGSTHEFNFLHEEDWSDVYVYPQQSFKMKPGLWRLLILDGAQELIRGELTVTP
ncbi:MAG TPA: hypothetical protein VKY31_02775, partial [Terriglobia bacterium]|nr:hypothetical protein [Terriglobia bacterium]